MFGVQYSSQTLPPWLEEMYRDIAERSKAQSHQPYEAYPGTRLAPYDIPDIRRSEELGRRTGSFEPYQQRAQTSIGAGTQRFPEQYQAYMNPYIQEVVNAIASEGNRNFTENILPALSGHFVSLGQHGSSRHADLAQRAARDIQEAIIREQGRARAQGYEKAANIFSADQLRALEAANAYANLGKTAQASNLADVAALREQGEAQRQYEQSKANTGYEDFLRQREHAPEKLSGHISRMTGMPYSSQSMGVNQYQAPQAPQTNTAGRLGEIAGSLLGARHAGIFKKGGSVSSHHQPSKHCFGMKSLKFIVSKSKPKTNKVMRGRI